MRQALIRAGIFALALFAAGASMHAADAQNVASHPTPCTQASRSRSTAELTTRAAQFLTRKDYAKAIDLYLRAQRLDPKDPEIVLELTTAYFVSGASADALRAAESLDAPGTASACIHEAMAKLLAANALDRQAIVEFQKANQLGDTTAELFLNLGMAYSRLGEFEKAKESYFASIQADSGKAAPYMRMGADYLQQNLPPRALAWLTRAVAIDPKNQESLFLLSTALVNGRFYETAQTYLEKYVVLRPDDPKGWLLLGDAYMNDEQSEKGLKNYQAALVLLPQVASAHYLVGYAYYQLNDLANAGKYLSESLALDPTFLQARLWLANIAYRQNQNDEARKQLTLMMGDRPPSADASELLAKIDIRAKQYEEAKKVLLQALEKYPDDQRFHYLLALLYRNMGETEKARQELNTYEVAEKMRQLRHRYVRHSFVYVQ